ncbi:hypothetical protein A3Q56_07807 [Intoshia linei]|uniref:Diacylglycerol kinase n=1 Tax=Intoshia linei TaxID=1819745 RepID=A0A177AR79_9BILA|nr:hypothetical protein A3Q56_07807 [Intoshia linei]
MYCNNYLVNINQKYFFNTISKRCISCYQLFELNFKPINSIYCVWCNMRCHLTGKCFDKVEYFNEACPMNEYTLSYTKVLKVKKNESTSDSLNQRNTTYSRTKFIINKHIKNIDTCIIVFVNPLSGGKQGYKLLRHFYRMLNPRQVVNLLKESPFTILKYFKSIQNIKILIAGGDGTYNWIMGVITKLQMQYDVITSIIPLGTGNDLAIVTKWGNSFNLQNICKLMIDSKESQIVNLDRWALTSQLRDYDMTTFQKSENNEPYQDDEATIITNTSETSGQQNTSFPTDIITNYFSIGADAEIVLIFDKKRKNNPEKFNSRMYNKYVYAITGGERMIGRKTFCNLYKYISIKCDNVDITQKIKTNKYEVVVFLNIPSYSGGRNIWGNTDKSTKWKPQKFDDKIIEIVGITTSQMALIQVGALGDRLAQGSKIEIETYKPFPMQIDGEPIVLVSSNIQINHKNQVKIMSKSTSQNLEFSPIPKPIKHTLYIFVFNKGSKVDWNIDFDELRKNISTNESPTISVVSEDEVSQKSDSSIFEYVDTKLKHDSTHKYPFSYIGSIHIKKVNPPKLQFIRGLINLNYHIDYKWNFIFIYKNKTKIDLFTKTSEKRIPYNVVLNDGEIIFIYPSGGEN